MTLDPYLSPLSKVNLKWIKDWNIRHETIQLLEENLEKTVLDMGLGSNFLYVTLIEKATKLKQMRLHRTKKCLENETINKMKGSLFE